MQETIIIKPAKPLSLIAFKEFQKHLEFITKAVLIEEIK